jgi:hypothetical protein
VDGLNAAEPVVHPAREGDIADQSKSGSRFHFSIYCVKTPDPLSSPSQTWLM